jgi:hypothetical protein
MCFAGKGDGNASLGISHSCVAMRASILLLLPASSCLVIPRVVWFTGHRDLRVHDHGGLSGAAAAGGPVVPLFVLDPKVHLRGQDRPSLVRLHTALSSLESELLTKCGTPLVVRHGDCPSVLKSLVSECSAAACHAIEDDVVTETRAAQQAALSACGAEVCRWSDGLRPEVPVPVPATFPEYCSAIENMALMAPAAGPGILPAFERPLASDGVPSLDELLRMAEEATPRALREARAGSCATTEPYAVTTAAWCAHGAARAALDEYVSNGRDAFADAHFGDAVEGAWEAGEAPSLHAAAAQWLVAGNAPSAVLAQRETAARAFSPALALGVLSAREVLQAARRASEAPLSAADAPPWTRSSEG